MFWKTKLDSEKVNVTKGENAVKAVKNWYSDRYETIIVQRNILFLLLILSFIVVIISVVGIVRISSLKSFDPFVIQVEDETGIARIVNPLSGNILAGNEALSKFFIKRYLTARETYNPVDYSTYARKVVRLLSSQSVYWFYLNYIRDEKNDPIIKYGQKNTSYLRVRSWSKLDNEGKKYMVRFSLHETAGSKSVYNKIAIVEFDYITMELSEEEKDINPVGFQVIGYRVDDDNS